MTFILSLGNPDQYIQISDRRLSSNGKSVDDDYNKAGILLTKDARHIFGFTGLARYGNFETKRWLLESLFQCCAPDYQINKIAKRLKEKANKDFKTHPVLRNMDPAHKRLGIIFSGYNYYMQPPLGALGILTNYQDFQINENDPPGRDLEEAREEFVMHYWSEKRPLDHSYTSIQYVGNWRAFDMAEEPRLRKLLQERRSTTAIVNKAVSTIRKMADRSQSQGSIGKNISVCILERDQTSHVEGQYYSALKTPKTYKPDFVIGISDSIRDVIENTAQPGIE